MGLQVASGWGLTQWLIVGGLAIIYIALLFMLLRIEKRIFDKQLNILGEALDGKAKTLYFDQLRLIDNRIDKEMVKLETRLSGAVDNHNKDVLFLLQEIDKNNLPQRTKDDAAGVDRGQASQTEESMRDALKVSLEKEQRVEKTNGKMVV